jgi:hypothetical protein
MVVVARRIVAERPVPRESQGHGLTGVLIMKSFSGEPFPFALELKLKVQQALAGASRRLPLLPE